MATNDPIADLLTRIRNAQAAGHRTVSAPYSRIKLEIAKLLQEEGYVEAAEHVDSTPFASISIRLKYHGESPVITGLKRESRPSQRRYVDAQSIPEVLDGFGVAVLSTSQGIMTGRRAKEAGVGGEVLCSVW